MNNFYLKKFFYKFSLKVYYYIKKIITNNVWLNYKIYNVLVFSCKTIQIVSSDLTPHNENKSPNSKYYINNESKKKGSFKSSSENEKYLPGIKKKGGENSNKYQFSTTSKKNINVTYSNDGTSGEDSQNNKSGLKIEFTPFVYGTTYKKVLKKGISKQKSGTNENNNGNNEGIIEELENDDEGTIEKGGNDNIIKKLNFEDVDVDVDDNSKLKNCIQEDNSKKLDDKQKEINEKYIIKHTETNDRCCCC